MDNATIEALKQWKDLQDNLPKQPSTQSWPNPTGGWFPPQACPNCGRCPACGRRDIAYPFITW